MEVKFKLDALLKAQGMSHRELARRTGISHPYISAICNNKVVHLPVQHLSKICQTLDCDIDDIMELKKPRE